LISIVFGLIAAASWGAGDFFGGLSSRRMGAYLSVFFSEAAGLGILLLAVLFTREPFFSLSDLAFSLVAGGLGAFGLVLLYRALIAGPLSIAAPVSALLAALVPILVGAWTAGLPGPLKLAGFALALLAVWLIAQGDSTGPLRLSHLSELGLPFISGLCFGLYFVLIHQAAVDSILWPMIAGRFAGGTVLALLLLLRREPLRQVKAAWGLALLNTLMDLGGNLFYILAGQAGRMDVAAVLSALYPGVTVLLAWLFLKERIGRSQSVGILAALAAIALMTL
jgi:drug/metabolite transporter (DMT)-like permease